MEGYSHLLWPSIPFKGRCKERLSFFFFLPTCIVTVNPHGAESANISGKLRRKGRAKFFSLPPPLRPYPSLSYLSVVESQWFIIIGRCHHADDTQSALWISLVPLHTSALFFFFFLSFLLVPSFRGSFRDSIFQKVIIIHESAYQYAEIGIIGNEGACLIVVFSFATSSENVEESPRVWRRMSVFVWLYLTLLCSGVHCISLWLQSVLCSPPPPHLPLVCIYQPLLG